MEKTKIEWANSSWNPVSGCYHDCEYCYARRTASRFKGCDKSPDGTTNQKMIVLEEREMVTSKDGVRRNAAYPYGFTPTFHKYRLNDLDTKHFGKTIFVGSTADIFGDWIPNEWIVQIFKKCLEHPEHRYLFLTKNPKRYLELGQIGWLPEGDEFWYGTTATGPDTQAFWSDRYNTFVSFEPLLEKFEKNEGAAGLRLGMDTDWAIIGAETGTRKGKVVPEREWIEAIVEEYHAAGKPVFMKDSLIPIWGEDLIREFPW